MREAIESYAKINELSLGRKAEAGANNAGNAGRYVMVEKDQIQQTLSMLDKTNAGELHELQSMRDAMRQTLRAARQRKRARCALRRARLAAFARAGAGQGRAGRTHRRQRLPSAQARRAAR